MARLGVNPESVQGQFISTIMQFKTFPLEATRSIRELAKANPNADNSSFIKAMSNMDNGKLIGGLLVHGWMASLLPLYLNEYYKDNPLFADSKIVTSIYNNGFEGSLNSSFIDKIKFDKINESEIETFTNPNYINILINAIENSDAVIKGSEELPAEIVAFLSNCDKPVLNYSSDEGFEKAYLDFYLNEIL